MRSWQLHTYRRRTANPKQAWGWTLISPNGKIVCASSEGFARPRNARRNARATLRGLIATHTR